MRIQLLTVNKLIIGLFCLFIAISTWAQVKPVVLVLGDSLSAEYGIPRGTGWVRILEEQLIKDKSPWTVFNASISGETSSGGLTRLPSLLSQKKPGIVVIELGANDALRGLAINQTEINLRKGWPYSEGRWRISRLPPLPIFETNPAFSISSSKRAARL